MANEAGGGSQLPIYSVRERLIEALRSSKRLILQAPTGSGKSTQVPQFILDAGLAEVNGKPGRIVVLQPRRIAARLLAKRVADERRVKLGEEVGYQYRLENVSSGRTRIFYVTEGILLRQMQEAGGLAGVSVVVFDEFHERHLEGDVALARARQIQEAGRSDLKIIVMSATLDTEVLETFLHPCEVVKSEGRTFPVSVEYLPKPSEAPVWELAVDALEKREKSVAGDSGHVLIFMPGAYEIQRTIQALNGSDVGRKFAVCPLHGELSASEQDLAVSPSEQRRVIVSTNVAETSLTIDGVRTVIDSGLARVPKFDANRGINTLLVEKISRASAQQRLGRAGRTGPGHGMRLWTQLDHDQRSAQTKPEVKRLELSGALLTLKASGVAQVRDFPWVEAPDEKALERALLLLRDLGAMDSHERLTSLGERMAEFPIHPRYARMLLEADKRGCVRAAALIASLSQSRGLFLKADKRTEEQRADILGDEEQSDFFLMMRAWKFAQRSQYNPQRCGTLGIHAGAAREVGGTFDQLLRVAERERLRVESDAAADGDALQKCVLAGFSDQLAKRTDGGTLRCRLVHQRTGELTRESAVRTSPLLVAGEIREISSRGDELRVVLSDATAVKEEWLSELFPDDFSTGEETVFDSVNRRVVTRKTRLFRDLILDYSEQDCRDAAKAAEVLSEEVIAGRCPLKNWDDAVDQWFFRVACLREWMPELNLPLMDDVFKRLVVERICEGAFNYKAIKDAEVWPALKEALGGQGQRALEQYAPERLELPGGRRAKLVYALGTPPTMAARIQDLYGVTQLAVAKGRIPVTIQILAPNQRPVQVTTDLGNFWKESYPKLKVELSRKYPKHEWR